MIDRHAASSIGAATKLLEREPPEGYRAEWTRHVAEQKHANTAELRSCVVFRIGSAFLALPAAIVEVVAEDSAFHTIPQLRSSMAVTLANVRGELLISVLLNTLLGIDTAAAAAGRKSYRYLIACRKGNERFAFPVDQVCGVEHFRTNEVNALPATLAGSASNYARGLLSVRNQAVALLHEELLFAALSKYLYE